MSTEDNKALIRRYIQAIDDKQTSDWGILDEYIADDLSPTTLRIPASV